MGALRLGGRGASTNVILAQLSVHAVGLAGALDARSVGLVWGTAGHSGNFRRRDSSGRALAGFGLLATLSPSEVTVVSRAPSPLELAAPGERPKLS